MSLRKQITVRFLLVVSSILLIALLSIYFFTAYFLNKNFYQRLNNRAETVVGWLAQTVENKEDIKLLKQLLETRKDEMPEEEIVIYNLQNEKIFAFNNENIKKIDPTILSEIRLNFQKEFTVNGLDAVGVLYKTPEQRFMVIALARNEHGQEFLKLMRWLMFCIIVISVVVITIIGWFFSKITIEPIIKIGDELNHIFPQNLNHRLKSYKNDNEIGHLSININQLLDRVEEGINLQQMFIANVSHELQNPLTRISSQLEVSLLNDRNNSEYKHTIESVLEDTSNLIDLTQNLLNLSRSNAESKMILIDKVRIDEVLWEVKNSLTKSNPNYNVDINFIALPEDPEHLCIVGSHGLIYTAILNIVENACKFSADNQAYINLKVSPKAKTIIIKDNGKGIRNEELKNIFLPFYRSDKTTDIKGYGIGLSLVDRIVKIHNGSMEVSSIINKGTVFKITFDT
jgi:signal transduction histidine kinase